jgi:multidrug transporter EmrE-like cation transporter
LLTPFSILLVLSAAFLHASWNALLRGGVDRGQSMLIMNITVGIAGLAMMAIAGLPSLATAYVIASGLIHLVYNALLVRMYRSGDLGETYPIARGSSPALVALGGSLFAAEWMDVLGSIGIGLVCIGIFMLALAKGRLHAMNLPWALATGISIASYTVIDGIGVRASGNWIAYTGGMFAFFLLLPLWYWVRGKRDFRAADGGRRQGGQWRPDLARSLRRHHLGDAGKRHGRDLGATRNQRRVRSPARSRLSQRAADPASDRGLLHHRRRRRLRRLARVNFFFKRKTPPNGGVFRSRTNCQTRR